MGALPAVSDRAPVAYDYFPTQWQAVVWRNWGVVPANRIAEALGADEADVREAAGRMGLNAALHADPEWLRRGYLTVIRENWHLCSFEQIQTLLSITAERLAFLLKEDDFLWHKMGQQKPLVDPPRLAPLTGEQAKKTDEIRAYLRGALPYEDYTRDDAFEFVRRFSRPLTDEERRQAIEAAAPDDTLRTIYSYFALYGDPLLDPSLDPFPEALLAEYARVGVKGVWMQGLLYQLVPFPFDREISDGCERRMENLNRLIERAARYGIGVYLYLNEPRAMDEAFFARHPALRGKREGDFWAMCTSHPEVQAYLEDAMYRLFLSAKGLAGFITITMSENLTNCLSRYGDGVPCPRCEARPPEQVIAEVNNLMARGAHRANPTARAIAWNWAWGDEWAVKVPPLFTEGQIVQCTSEERLPTRIGGVEGYVVDYTMSQCGPGGKARAVWRAALESGHACCAKVQLNNTWEASAQPWLPVMNNVAGHVKNLMDAGVKHLQLSWTLGGYPSPNLKLAAWLMAGRGDVGAFLRDWLGENLGEVADRAQRVMSEAFSEFPFHVGVLYTAPQNYAPMAPFFLKKTGWTATMIGFPYDDLDTWRVIYPPEVFLRQFEKVAAGFSEAVSIMAPRLGESEAFDDMARMAAAAQCHFSSTRNHIAFVMARDCCDKAGMRKAVAAEREAVLKTIALRRADSRIGYEASNHYYYTVQDLLEKMLNLRYVEDALRTTS